MAFRRVMARLPGQAEMDPGLSYGDNGNIAGRGTGRDADGATCKAHELELHQRPRDASDGIDHNRRGLCDDANGSVVWPELRYHPYYAAL